MTIDDLAIATQREFQEVRKEMGEMENRILREVLRAIDRVDAHLSAFMSRSNDDTEKLRESVNEHEGRLRILERRK